MSGDEKDIEALAKLLSSHKLPSIITFTGETGTGKTAFMKDFAERLKNGSLTTGSDTAVDLQKKLVILTSNLIGTGSSTGADWAKAYGNATQGSLSAAMMKRFSPIPIAPMTAETQMKVAEKLVERQIRKRGIEADGFAEAQRFVMGSITDAFNAEEGVRGISNMINQVFDSGTFDTFVARYTASGRQRIGSEVAEVVGRGVITNTEAPSRASFRRRTVP